MEHLKTFKQFYESREEDLELYNKAKDAYYNGNPIMGDAEFDELERKLGLENQGYIGTHHSDNYTVKHPIKMGSLSKIQIKEGSDGQTHFDSYIDTLNKYFQNVPDDGIIEVTPKFDGCSFEVVFDDEGNVEGISTRGDGEYGTDVSHWLSPYVDEIPYKEFLQKGKKLVVRGEALISFNDFNAGYQDKFANTRAFVAGMFGQKWDGKQEQLDIRKDLSIVVYDFRLVSPSGSYQWVDYNTVPGYDVCAYNVLTFKKSELSPMEFARIYEEMEKVRKDYKFPLDGFVLKPEVKYRKTEDVQRPSDCVAIKYKPSILETEITEIEWNVGKTGELFPKAVFKTIKMDGKNINKASLHNYGYVKDNNVGVGSIIKISLAGDIIPFVYEIVRDGGDNMAPTENVTVKGPHLMIDLSAEEKVVIKVIAGAEAINIRNFKEATIRKIMPEFFTSEDVKIENVLDFMKDESIAFMKERFGTGTSIMNIVNALTERRKTLTLNEIILALQFRLCGKVAADVCAKFIKGDKSNHLIGVPGEVKRWLLDENSQEYQTIMGYANLFKVNMAPEAAAASTAIPVIMTGSPKEFGYVTKAAFLAAHPEYIETSDWKQCKILFTDDMSSTSGKMKKAAALGVEVKTYGEA